MGSPPEDIDLDIVRERAKEDDDVGRIYRAFLECYEGGGLS